MAEYNCNSSVVNGTIFFSSRRSLWLEVKTGINANSTAMLVSYEALEKQGRVLMMCNPEGRGKGALPFGRAARQGSQDFKMASTRYFCMA